LQELSEQIDGTQPSPLDYYPLLKPGDRFPINDPTLAPCLDPRPADPVAFLHGLLDSMARIEAEGYARLQALGATPLTQVWTAGGGAQNRAWTALRQRRLGVPVQRSPQQEAAYGTARLAQWQGLQPF
jgi:sugar (pentulose or hexulose) kinase